MRACLISTSGLVENVIIIGDGYEPPEGMTIVIGDVGQIGDTYADGVFTSPPVEPSPAPPRSVRLWSACYNVSPNADGVITGIEDAIGIDGVIYYSTGLYGVIFTPPAGMINFYASAWDNETKVRADDTTKSLDGYFEINATDLASGEPVDPENFSFEIKVIS